MNKIFIDNINGAELSIKDIDSKKINDLISKKLMEPNKIIMAGILNFYGGNKNEQIGKCKGIDNDNFISEFKIFIENNDGLKNKIKNIILPKIGRTDHMVKLIIEEKTINQNTIDFISSILMYMKDGFNQKLENFLRKTENNNWIIPLFMLNVKENSDQYNRYHAKIENVEKIRKSRYCKGPIWKDGESNSFYERKILSKNI